MIRQPIRSLTRRHAALVAVALALAVASPATAESAFGCTGLDGRWGAPAVEGVDGTFFRVDPDLQMLLPFTDRTADRLADLARALGSMGTTLVYVPLPTRALAMPERLPDLARDLGYDPATAATVYQGLVGRLRARDLLVVDARATLRAAAGDPPSFFATDERLTPEGARRLAEAVGAVLAATPGFADLPKNRFESRAAGRVTLDSDLRDLLQRRCSSPLPAVEAEAWVTSRLQGSALASGQSLLGAGTARIPVALLGTAQTDEVALDLAGLVSERTGLEVNQYAVAGDDPFAAISSYLTSRAFQEARPAYLVWIVPASASLAGRGDRPLRELVAAAGTACLTPLPTAPGAGPGSLVADLAALDPGTPVTLLVDAGGAAGREARFDFVSGAGLVRTRTIVRDPGQAPTDRFYVPMSGLWPDGARSVEVTLDVPLGPGARVTACAD